jgi:hypothetical protein
MRLAEVPSARVARFFLAQGDMRWDSLRVAVPSARSQCRCRLTSAAAICFAVILIPGMLQPCATVSSVIRAILGFLEHTAPTDFVVELR